MESDKISQCCCDLFKIQKRQVIVSLRVITKVFLLRHSNVSLENRKKPLCPVPKENDAKMPGEVQVEQSISSTSS